MFISSFWSKSLIWVLVSLPSLLVPCIFFFILLFTSFTFSSILQPYSTISVSILITSVLNSASDRLAISLSLSSFFGFWSVLSFGPYLSWCSCYTVRGGAIGICQGGATHVTVLWCSLNECFFFNFLVVRLHTVRFFGSSGYFCFLNLLLSFSWLCE